MRRRARWQAAPRRRNCHALKHGLTIARFLMLRLSGTPASRQEFDEHIVGEFRKAACRNSRYGLRRCGSSVVALAFNSRTGVGPLAPPVGSTQILQYPPHFRDPVATRIARALRRSRYRGVDQVVRVGPVRHGGVRLRSMCAVGCPETTSLRPRNAIADISRPRSCWVPPANA